VSKKIFIITIFLIFFIIAGTFYFQKEKQELQKYKFSFEDGMQGWVQDGTDLINPPINWSINRTQLIFYNGSYAVQLYLENFNDPGKIWTEHNFSVEPHRNYEIKVSNYFGTYDYGDVNLFNLITGVSTKSPETADDLIYQGDTGHHRDTKDLVWLQKQFTFQIKTEEKGNIVVFIGVWGTWETTRMYLIDDVNVSVKELNDF
jgi:hypothetical protein